MVDRASLDDPAAVAAADPGAMLPAVARLGNQLRLGFDIGTQGHGGGEEDATAIVVCGMGGSGIAGDVVRSLVAGRLDVPILACKSDALPGFCDSRTIVLPVSYSGRTQETVACYREAVRRRCRVVTLSSGGPLREEAIADGAGHLEVPDDAAMPRVALGYLAGALLGWMDRQSNLGLGGEVGAGARALDAHAVAWSPPEPAERNEAKSLASWLLGRTPVVWGSEGLMEAAALRLKSQINENAKMPAFSSVLPELDHNEIEGWGEGAGQGFGIVALRHDGEASRMAQRFDASIEVVAASGAAVREVRVEGSGPFERLFGTILLGDFASAYLAILRGVDPTPIPVLTGLKARLAP